MFKVIIKSEEIKEEQSLEEKFQNFRKRNRQLLRRIKIVSLSQNYFIHHYH